jgi:hypothetical protein
VTPGVADLDAFDAPVRAFPSVDGLTMAWSPRALECAERSLELHGLCLLGEIHGVA